MTLFLPENSDMEFYKPFIQGVKAVLRPQLLAAEIQSDTWKYLEEQRQKFQIGQLNVQYLQQQENRKFQEKQASLNYEHQKNLQRTIQRAQLKLEYLRITHQNEQEKVRQVFQERLAKLNYQHNREIQDFIQSVNWAIHQGNLEFQKWRFQQEKALQEELAAYNRQTQLEVASYQRETAIKLAHVQAEVQKIFANWPLTLMPAQILEFQGGDSQIPLRVFVAPPRVQFDRFVNAAPQGFPDVELTLNQRLREFFDQYSSQGRIIKFSGGAWESNRFHSEASIQALFGMLKSEPTLILESEIDGDYLNFRIAYWGVGQETYRYQTIISRLSYRGILYEAAKNRALKWKETKQKLLALGKAPAEVEKRGGDNEINLNILEEEKALREADIDNEELQIHYKINSQHFEDLYKFLITCHCLVAGGVADAHHLFHNDLLPLLPELLADITKNIPDWKVVQEIVETVVSGYRDIYKTIEVERSHWVPELFLQLAQGLVNLPDKSWAKSQVIESVQCWLKHRVASSEKGDSLEAMLEVMKPVLTMTDKEYLEKLRECLSALGDNQAAATVLLLSSSLTELKTKNNDEDDLETKAEQLEQWLRTTKD